MMRTFRNKEDVDLSIWSAFFDALGNAFGQRANVAVCHVTL